MKQIAKIHEKFDNWNYRDSFLETVLFFSPNSKQLPNNTKYPDALWPPFELSFSSSQKANPERREGTYTRIPPKHPFPILEKCRKRKKYKIGTS